MITNFGSEQMYNIGDLIIYSAHGICEIDDICEKTVLGKTRKYYVLHPLENNQQLTIHAPVNNDKVVMQELINKEEAIEILDSFKDPGLKWNDNANKRFNEFTKIVKTGNRKEIAKVVNTLMRKRIELERIDKQLYQKDETLLNDVQNTLFKELSISLDTSDKAIHEMVLKKMSGE